MRKGMYSIALAVIVTSCYKQPKACFTVDKTEAAIGEVVTFKDCSENTTRRVLTIGETASGFPIAVDFETGTATYIYHAKGTYTVELESLFCKGDKCRSDKTTQTIIID